MLCWFCLFFFFSAAEIAEELRNEWTRITKRNEMVWRERCKWVVFNWLGEMIIWLWNFCDDEKGEFEFYWRREKILIEKKRYNTHAREGFSFEEKKRETVCECQCLPLPAFCWLASHSWLDNCMYLKWNIKMNRSSICVYCIYTQSTLYTYVQLIWMWCLLYVCIEP